jgi:phage tail-like protein
MAGPTPRTFGPYAAFNFAVSFSTPPKAVPTPFDKIGFMECSGLDGENMPMEYRDSLIPDGGTSGAFHRKLPGMERYPNVVMRRGITGHPGLWNWRKKVRDGEPWDQITGDILVTLQDEKHQSVMQWKLISAWPCKLSGPTINAKTNEIAIEALELCCDRIEILDS